MRARDDVADQHTLIERCRELVDIPSVSYHEAEIEQYIRAALPPSFEITIDDDGVLFARTARRSDADLVVLAGHTDTVPIADNLPSALVDGVLSGRGTSDMKAGLAVMIELARWMDADGISAPFDLGLLFFAREELPPEENPLVPALENNAELRAASFAILMEPTANAIEAGCQGNINLRLDFIGEAAHTARPWKGVNSAHNAIMALQQIAAASPNDVEVDGLLFREVASITGIRSGVARNVLPHLTEVDINIRYAPINNPEAVENVWRAKMESLGAQVTVLGNARPAPVVIHHPIVEQLLAAGAGAPLPKQAWTNAADFAAVGIQAVNFGPGDPAFAHRQDEQIEVTALLKSFRILQQLVAP